MGVGYEPDREGDFGCLRHKAFDILAGEKDHKI